MSYRDVYRKLRGVVKAERENGIQTSVYLGKQENSLNTKLNLNFLKKPSKTYRAASFVVIVLNNYYYSWN